MSKLLLLCSFSLLSFYSYSQKDSLPYVILLGVTQDGGYPHIACNRNCCQPALKNTTLTKNVVALAIVSPKEKKWWLLEATPDISKQLQLFANKTKNTYPFLPESIFLTHAHMGHYTGLLYLGREALGTKNLPVYTLPGMKTFLENNGPWSQLVELQNIVLHLMKEESPQYLSPLISITPFIVPHRDEYSETAGFSIQAGSKKYLFIPDINKWNMFKKDIVELVRNVDVAFLDATFYSAKELTYRNISEVPHPFITETIELFGKEDKIIKKKIVLIHFNHTNPVIKKSEEYISLHSKGFNVGKQGASY